ncbi:MAG: RNA-directed DNA polymerase [Candidatus Hydrogenedentes bacterium]|nr:RNA-directed DNA polymerase [Candidatus Hydrogenedentota bacterium]
MSLLKRLFSGSGYDVAELARRLNVSEEVLRSIQPSYHEFDIAKKSGGQRRIAAPSPDLKDLQRRILRRVLGRLRAHTSVTGFERGYSIVSNAACHVGRAVVVQMDIENFFPSTTAKRVEEYFRKIGWNRDASALLSHLCTHKGALPQGAPTSPRLSNVVNFGMDARLRGLADKHGAVYTRYADDLTFSFAQDDREDTSMVIRRTKAILKDYGYRIHHKRKLHIRRRHQRQVVTGLTVNTRVSLPREVRRRLRAVEHHLAEGRPASMSAESLKGWHAFRQMVERQRDALG